MIRLDFDVNHHPENFTIILSHRNHEYIGQIANIDADSVTFVGNLNSAQELSFTVHKVMNGVEEPLWDEIYDLRYVYVKELGNKGMFFQITVELDDKQEDVTKQITCTSAGEAELSQTMLYNLEINSEDDIARKDYKVAKFWNPDDIESSLLYRVMSVCPNWSIKHVDDSLCHEQRTFSADDTSVYDFLTQTVAQEFNCIFEFDSVDRTISVYDLYTVCENDDCSFYQTNKYRYRGEFNDVCPICGSKKIKYFGKDTTVYVDKENLTDETQFTTSSDDVKNTFKLQAGDDLMTATVRNINPNGSDRLYYFSEKFLNDMSKELREKLKSYESEYNAALPNYTKLTTDIYDTMTEINRLTHTMMPTKDTEGEMTANAQIANVTSANLSPLAIRYLSSKTTKNMVENAVKNYVAVYVKRAYYQIDLTTSTYSVNDNGTGSWTGTITLTNREDINSTSIDRGKVTETTYDDPDTASTTLTITLSSNYEQYLNQKVAKVIGDKQRYLDSKGRIREPGNIYDVLSYKDTNKFRDAIKLYCLNRLESFQDAIDGGLSVLMEFGAGTPGVDGYSEVYVPLHDKYDIVTQEIQVRSNAIKTQNDKLEQLTNQRNAIQQKLNFRKYIGEDLYKEFLDYRREQTYENDNYICDGLINNDGTYDNGKIVSKAKEFFEKAQKDIVKSGEYQFSITSNLYDLLTIQGFEPLIDDFELGNFIRINVDGIIYRLRLIKFELNFGDLSRLETEFSDFTQTADGVNDIQSILSQTKSMATSYGTVETQAKKGEDAGLTIEQYRQYGLDSALTNIKNNENEEVTLTEKGLIAKTYDDISDSYGDEQLRVTHNILAFTDDNWKTVKTALGKFDYYDQNGKKVTGKYGLNADFVVSGYISGSTIVAGNIYSSDGKTTHIDLNSGDFNFGGNSLVYNNRSQKLTLSNGSISASSISGGSLNGTEITGGSISIGNNFSVDSNGFLTASGGTFNGSITGGSINIGNNFSVTTAGILTATNGTFNGSITGGSISIGSNFSVTSAGILSATSGTFSGKITSTSGTIGGFTIGTDAIGYHNGNVHNGWGNIASIERYSGQGLQVSNGNGWSLITPNMIAVANWNTNSTYDSDYYDKGRTDSTQILTRINSTGNNNINNSYYFYESNWEGRDRKVLKEVAAIYTDGDIVCGAYHSPVATRYWVISRNYLTNSDLNNYYTKSNVYTKQEVSDNFVKADTLKTYFNNVKTEDAKGSVSHLITSIYKDGQTICGRKHESSDLSGVSSDLRLKRDIYDESDISNFYLELKPKTYKYRMSYKGDKMYHGLIAQDVISLLKKYDLYDNNALVLDYNDPDDEELKILNGDSHFYGINYNELHAMHIQMIQKLWHRVDELENKIIELKKGESNGNSK